MAIKYWAEVTRAIPEPASVQTDTLVEYEVRVFEIDGDASTERQLKGPSVFGTGYKYAAVVRLDPAADIVEGDVETKDDTEYGSSGVTVGDVFTFKVRTSKPQTYTPSITIAVIEQSFTTIPWLNRFSARTIRAANKTKIVDFDGAVYKQSEVGYLTLTIDVPRQDTVKSWGVIGRGPSGYRWQTVKVPSVIFTKRVVPPPVPTGVFDGAADVEKFVSDVCNKRFIGIKARYRFWDAKAKRAITVASQQTLATKQVQYYIVGILESDIKAHPTADYDDHVTAGRVKTNIWQSAGWDWVSTGKAYVEPSTKATITAQSYRNEAIAYRKKLESTDCSKASGITSSSSSVPAKPNVTTTATLKSAETFNPPPHIMTRHFSPIAWGGTDSYDDGNSYNQLGMFYQDPDLVSNTAKVYDTKVQKFWGFRFIFNPTFYNYQMSQTNNVDWGRKNENNAVLITGGGTISLRLVLDRVADMNTVRRWVMNNRTATIGAPDYPISLTPEQCEGILRRGTEYDMEYMFRVFNGNPEKAPLLGNPVGNLEMSTANLGFITSLPFIFKLNDQLRYKVILSSLTVQHDLFTKEMIPIRSLVDITLERIPDFYYDKSKYLSIDSKTKLVQTLPASATASGSSSTPRRVPPRGAMGIE